MGGRLESLCRAMDFIAYNPIISVGMFSLKLTLPPTHIILLQSPSPPEAEQQVNEELEIQYSEMHEVSLTIYQSTKSPSIHFT